MTDYDLNSVPIQWGEPGKNSYFLHSRTDMISIPKRWEIALLLNSGIVIVYCLRVNMSIGVQDIRDELNWSEAEKGVVLSAFYWGYAIGAVPASKIAQVYGAKLIFGLSILIPSILTLFVPVACRTSIYLALACRCFLGLCESATFPALFQFYPLWIPLEEKQLLIAVINSGVYIVSSSFVYVCSRALSKYLYFPLCLCLL